jgi:hypothetical protein
MFYVTMTDKFMSGWGYAKGRINKLIVICQTIDQATQIENAAHKRSEMKYVNICTRRPRYGAHIVESWKTYEEMTGWRG